MTTKWPKWTSEGADLGERVEVGAHRGAGVQLDPRGGLDVLDLARDDVERGASWDRRVVHPREPSRVPVLVRGIFIGVEDTALDGYSADARHGVPWGQLRASVPCSHKPVCSLVSDVRCPHVNLSVDVVAVRRCESHALARPDLHLHLLHLERLRFFVPWAASSAVEEQRQGVGGLELVSGGVLSAGRVLDTVGPVFVWGGDALVEEVWRLVHCFR
mmetsp:Transcript_58255/g.133361  ORF Transcript_58255/g.133361 Transcript_58255/m.133361 type:complete len:216 (+) Transcript_58255:110-757(+)